MRQTASILAAGGFLAAAAYATLSAQAGSASQGIYTEEQATRGATVYLEQCAACHGDNLEGSGPMPPLAGRDFLSNWQGKPVSDLFEKTQATMPATAPGTLSGDQTADVVAYMLKSSGYAAGTTPLGTTAGALAAVTLDAPAAAAASAPAAAGGAASTGVFNAEQAARGATVYLEQCAACHGDNLEGSGPMPALAGRDFLSNWQGKSVADLFEKTQSTMPATAPGVLTGEQTADVIAYMLKASLYPEGAAPLPSTAEALRSIALDSPPPAQ